MEGQPACAEVIPESGRSYERKGERRTVTGVQRIGQGRGKAARVGVVWWKEPGSDKERRCTMAEFQQWQEPPSPP